MSFGGETGGGSAVLDTELRINPLEMFGSRSFDSEDHADLGIRFSLGEPASRISHFHQHRPMLKV